MPNILALDLATKTGWAESFTDDSGVKDFHFMPEEVMGARVCRMRDWLEASFGKMECIYYEQAHQRGGGATRSAMALIAAVELFAYLNQTPIYPIHTATIKKHATGSGKASKNEMITAAMDAFPNVKIIDDNHADALWLLDYALNHQASLNTQQYERTDDIGEDGL